MKLEDIRGGAIVSGIVSGQAVTILTAEWVGSQALNVLYRKNPDTVADAILYREDEPRLQLESRGKYWSFDADGALLRLVTEANRIKLAHVFDPYLAVHSSLVDPLPHQISAVFEEMLPRQPLRFLLADDPGAGKTIMAGLYIRLLIGRSDLERCLVVVPGSLVEQWQDELNEKFGLHFDILSRDMLETSGNPFSSSNLMIARLDMLARNEDLQTQLRAAPEWDLIIADEAHRMSATAFGSEVKYTKRYRLGQQLSLICRHFLLMSATPHNGREEDFQLFMALLDADRFAGRTHGVQVADVEDMMRRLTKEELLRFDGSPLLPDRFAYTVKYSLSAPETELYDAVTGYVRREMNLVLRESADDGKKRTNVGFALQILQRRLASSPAAIYHSLRRRRERLETALAEAGPEGKIWSGFSNEILRNLDELGQDEVDAYEDQISAGATSARTRQQLQAEVESLRSLESMALRVRLSGRDTKWQQLNSILDDELMQDASGKRRKLIIFTEPKDTLDYLHERVRARLGKPEAVDVIHGGLTRNERRRVVERFMQDRDLLVLVANDAAGEGVNLQRAHLMVNYDLPWNPSRIEQRFGRIHRIGQTEVCHLWNLVAGDTREGEVYGRLLEKLETAREALGGSVYDILGELFEERSLRDLLLEAIRRDNQESEKVRLLSQVDDAAGREHIRLLLEARQLTRDDLPLERVRELKLQLDRAEAQRLQPHHIQSFFVDAFRQLGGEISQRETGRWEITRVPLSIREAHRMHGRGLPLQKKYERICFAKSCIQQQPVAAFIYPGHPLLDTVTSLICEQNQHLLKQGALMIDDTDEGLEIHALFLLQHSVQDGTLTGSGKPKIISEKLQFAAVHREAGVTDAGLAPHLNLRPATREEARFLQPYLQAEWLDGKIEQQVMQFATVELARAHLEEVRSRRLPELAQTEKEVKQRLTREINHWDARAHQLREYEQAGRKTRLSSQNAQNRADNLAERLKRRLAQLELERNLAARQPQIQGAILAVPQGLLRQVAEPARPAGFSQDPVARRRVELAAMDAVFAAERRLGNVPVDVSAKNIGYDIESFDPQRDELRLIEVKGRAAGADTVMITRQEVITSLNSPERFILALVEVEDGRASAPRYVRGALDSREPPFVQTAIQFRISWLLEKSEAPA